VIQQRGVNLRRGGDGPKQPHIDHPAQKQNPGASPTARSIEPLEPKWRGMSRTMDDDHKYDDDTYEYRCTYDDVIIYEYLYDDGVDYAQ